MSISQTKILLATDGSEEATLAAKTAVDQANLTSSELHVVHVGEFLPMLFAHTEIEPAQIQQEARKLLGEQVERIGLDSDREPGTRGDKEGPSEKHLGLRRPARSLPSFGGA